MSLAMQREIHGPRWGGEAMGVSSGALLTIAGINLFLGYVTGLFFGDAFRRVRPAELVAERATPAQPERERQPPAAEGPVEEPVSGDGVEEVADVEPEPETADESNGESAEEAPVDSSEDQGEVAVEEPEPAAMAEQLEAIMSSVDVALVAADYELRHAGDVPATDDLITTLTDRATTANQALGQCAALLRQFTDPTPLHTQIAESVECAQQHVGGIESDLAQESPPQPYLNYSGRLLDALFQVRSRIEQLVFSWLDRDVHPVVEQLQELGGGSAVANIQDAMTNAFAAQPEQSLTLMLVDFDLVGSINEQHSPFVTDVALSELTQLCGDIVGECVCQQVICGHNLVFALTDDLDSAEQLAEKLRQSIDNSEITLAEAKLRFTASLALVEVSAGDSLATAFERLATTKDAAKSGGRNSSYAWRGNEPAIVLPVGVDTPTWRIDLSELVALQLKNDVSSR